jgi:hypothetical protein
MKKTHLMTIFIPALVFILTSYTPPDRYEGIENQSVVDPSVLQN